MAYANNNDPDLSAKPHNLIKVFAIHQYILQYQMVLQEDSEPAYASNTPIQIY